MIIILLQCNGGCTNNYLTAMKERYVMIIILLK